MSRSLKRILKVRKLVEDQSRVQLEAAVRSLAEVEQGIDSWQRRGTASRELARAAMINQDLEGRLASEVEEGLTKLRVERLKPIRETRLEQVIECREVFFEHRKLTMQASSLLVKIEAEAEAERLKKAQKALDEWYQSERRRSIAEEERRSQKENSSSDSSATSI
jgi:hypothetical protein